MPHYADLLRRGSMYHFNAKVPADLRSHYAPSHVRKSLGTKDHAEAVRRAREERRKLDREFDRLRRSIDLSEEDAERLATAWLADALAQDEWYRVASGDAVESADTYALEVEGEWREALARLDTHAVEREASKVLKSASLTVPRDSEGYRRLAVALLKARVRFLEAIQERNAGRIVEAPKVDPGQPGALRYTLADLLEDWLKERRPPAKTESEWRLAVRRFEELHGGGVPLSRITRKHVLAFKDHWLTEKHKRPATVRKQLAALGSLFSWAVANARLDSNPAASIPIARERGKGRAERKARVSFSAEDLRAIFSSPVYASGERPKGGGGDAAYWLPLLALYTGARLGELGQLRVVDVKEASGVKFLYITNEHEGATLKTESSRRRVPIHADLVKLGFLQYVELRRRGGDERLFPELRVDNKGTLTGNFSKWFGRYLREFVGIKDKRRTFHSFRHTFKDVCREAEVSQEVHDALTGHAGSKSVGAMYGGDEYPLRPLAAAVERLRFPKLLTKDSQ